MSAFINKSVSKNSLSLRELSILLVSFLILFACKPMHAQQLKWAVHLGGAGVNEGRAVATDSEGNVITTGVFFGSPDFDPGPDTFTLTASVQLDVYIQKLDADGNFIWAKKLAGSDFEESWNIAIDDSDNIYISGHFSADIDLSTTPGVSIPYSNLGGADIFVVKLDSGGEVLWGKTLQGTDFCSPQAMRLDNNNDLIVAGEFKGSFDLDPDTTQIDLVESEGLPANR